MKIYLQYPFSYSDSPYYKNLIKDLPSEIEFVNVEKQKGVIVNKKKFKFSDNLKRIIKYFLNNLFLPIPNAYFTKSKKTFDLIHCAHCLSLNKKFPWVTDIEFESQMWGGARDNKLRKKIAGKFLRAKNCKKILPWMEWTKEKILKDFPEVSEKMEVVYPAIPLPTVKRKEHKNLNLVFSGRYFYAKGGLHALEVIDRLTKKHENVYAVFNSFVPEEILAKYSENKKIKFCELIPQEELFEIYSTSDIFVYPGYSDSFGFGFLEAMSFGIPIVTVDNIGRKEIVTEKTGFVIDVENFSNFKAEVMDEETIGKIEEKVDELIVNDKLRKVMSEEGITMIRDGRFSIKERNKKLERIYSEALK